MTKEEEQLFRIWKDEQKAHVRDLEEDAELRGGLRDTFIDRALEPFGTWKAARLRNGIMPPQQQQHTADPLKKPQQAPPQAPPKAQTDHNQSSPNNQKLEDTKKKYGLVADDKGLRMGPWVADWDSRVADMKAAGYQWSRDTKRFVVKMGVKA